MNDCATSDALWTIDWALIAACLAEGGACSSNLFATSSTCTSQKCVCYSNWHEIILHYLIRLRNRTLSCWHCIIFCIYITYLMHAMYIQKIPSCRWDQNELYSNCNVDGTFVYLLSNTRCKSFFFFVFHHKCFSLGFVRATTINRTMIALSRKKGGKRRLRFATSLGILWCDTTCINSQALPYEFESHIIPKGLSGWFRVYSPHNWSWFDS